MSGKKPKAAPHLTEADKRRVVSVLSELDLAEHPHWWASLEALSSRTQFDGIEVFEDEIEVEPDDAKKFHGNANVYVTLAYGGTDDETSTSDAFPVQFKGHFEGAEVKIDEVVVDTSSFYGDERDA